MCFRHNKCHITRGVQNVCNTWSRSTLHTSLAQYQWLVHWLCILKSYFGLQICAVVWKHGSSSRPPEVSRRRVSPKKVIATSIQPYSDMPMQLNRLNILSRTITWTYCSDLIGYGKTQSEAPKSDTAVIHLQVSWNKLHKRRFCVAYYFFPFWLSFWFRSFSRSALVMLFPSRIFRCHIFSAPPPHQDQQFFYDRIRAS